MMNILVLQSVRYDLIGYDRAIDHERHRVFYIGAEDKLAQIPQGLRCEKIAREGRRTMFEEVAEAMSKLDQRFDLLISVSEQELLDAARLRARFGIPGPTPAQAEKVRDKTVMKRCVAAAGIRAPRFASLDHWLAGQRLSIGEHDPVILKPVDGASSNDVKRFDSERHLSEAITKQRTGVAALDNGAAYDASHFEVEEYVEGAVMHFDGIAKQGAVQILVASRYVNTPMAFAHGAPMGSVQIDLAPFMKDRVDQILAAVEIRDGAFHLEMIEGKDGLIFLEIAHRVGGARVTETFERKTGVHLGVADIRTIVDPDYVIEPVWDRSHYYGWFVAPAHHLDKPYCAVSGYESLLSSNTLVELNVLGPDQPAPRKITYVETLLPLAGLLRAAHSEEMVTALQTLFGELKLEGFDTPGTPVTADGTLCGAAASTPQRTHNEVGSE